MIHSVLIFNSNGKARLTKHYWPSSPQYRARFLEKVFQLVSVRDDSLCNFVELPAELVKSDALQHQAQHQRDDVLRVIYRHYATLYFAFVVDQSESELAILDLIQVFVESLDRCFENVCELDLIFHFDEVHLLLACMITGGLVLDTSIESIQQSFSNSMKARKQSQGTTLSGIAPTLGGEWDKLALGPFRSRR